MIGSGSITISRVTCSHNDDYIQIRIRGKKSKCLISGNMTVEEFGRCITGLGEMPITITHLHEEKQD